MISQKSYFMQKRISSDNEITYYGNVFLRISKIFTTIYKPDDQIVNSYQTEIHFFRLTES